MQEDDLRGILFQQDCAICHTARVTVEAIILFHVRGQLIDRLDRAIKAILYYKNLFIEQNRIALYGFKDPYRSIQKR